MIIKLSGGLGNQLFQYALGRSLQKEYGIRIVYDEGNYKKDITREVEIPKICPDYVKISDFHSLMWKVKTKIGRYNWFEICKEQRPFVYEKIDKKYSYIIGSWQNVNYFKDIREQLVKEIIFKDMLNDKQEQIVEAMKQETSIAVHMRRSDYMKLKDIYVIAGLDYYHKAMQYFLREYGTCKFYIFSDDIAWCEANVNVKSNCLFINEEFSTSACADFEMMRNCKSFIIANSTFSWWASWLANAYGKKIIAPVRWYCDEEMDQDVKNALLRECILI